MILAIDIGNSHSVFALCDNNNILCRFRIATDTKITSDALAVWLSGVLKLHDFDISVITHVIVCSVVPAFDNAISSMSVTYLQQPAYFLKSDDLNITVSLPHPETVGIDRLVNAVAAKHLHGNSLIIIDFGTATTFDVIDDNGHYVGGIIATGPEISLRALTNATAKLPSIALTKPDTVLGKTTVSAMQSGIYYGYLAMIEGLLNRLQAEVFPKKPATVLATGGLSTIFAPPLNISAIPDLTINGMILTKK